MMARSGVSLFAIAGLFAAGVLIYVLSVRSRPPKSRTTISEPAALPVRIPESQVPRPVLPSVLGPALTLEVVDMEGRPIEGARALDIETCKSVLGRTDDKGIARLALGISMCDWTGLSRLRIEHDRFAPAVIQVPQRVTDVRVILYPMAVLAVRVVDRLGLPVVGATVRVSEPEWGVEGEPWWREWTTLQGGEVRIPGLRPGALVVRASARGYMEGRNLAVVEAGETRDVRVVLPPGKVLEVFVRTNSGAPVAGSEVKVGFDGGGMSSSPEDGAIYYVQVRTTDREGKAMFGSLPVKLRRSWIEVSGPRHLTQDIEFEAEEPQSPLEVVVEEGGRMTVDVLDALDRSIACDIYVNIPGDAGYYCQSMIDKSAGAKVELTGLPMGQKFDISIVRHRGQVLIRRGIVLESSVNPEVILRLPEQREIEFEAVGKRNESVSGRLSMKWRQAQDDGPEPGSPSYSAIVGRDGIARLSVNEGLYDVLFQPHQGPAMKREVQVVDDARIVFEIDTARSFAGILADSEGRLLEGWEAVWTEGESRWTTITAPDGSFAFAGVSGADGELWVGRLHFEVRAFSGSPPSAAVKVIAPVAGIRGKVIHPHGRPGLALITLKAAKAEDNFVRRAGSNLAYNAFATGPDGTFLIQVPARAWILTAYGEGREYESAPMLVDASAGAAPVTILLMPRQEK